MARATCIMGAKGRHSIPTSTGPFRGLPHAPLHRVAAHVFAVTAATLLAPSTGLAQTVEIGGHAAFYYPVGSLIEGPPIEKRLQGALMGGVEAVVWTSGRLGFAGKVAYARSPVAVIQAGNVIDRDASVILASARVLFAVTPLERAGGTMHPWSYYVGAGAGAGESQRRRLVVRVGAHVTRARVERGPADPRRAAGRDADGAGRLHFAGAIRRRDAERNRSTKAP